MEKVLGIFDKCFLINLDSCTDRLEKMTKRLNDLNIPFERIKGEVFDDAANFKWGKGARGCTISHLNCIKEAKKRNYDNILILVDDCIFIDNFLEIWYNNLLPKLKEIDYDIFYLHQHLLKPKKFDIEKLDIMKIDGTAATHFWVINGKFFDQAINIIETVMSRPTCSSIDLYFNSRYYNNKLKIFATNYNLTGQDQGYSSIAFTNISKKYIL